jgi:Methyltransferase domain
MTTSSAPFFTNDGYCIICMAPTRFVAHAEWLRDYYLCNRCGSIPRQRALVEILRMVRPQWRGLTIHESSPTMMNYFGGQCPNYSYSFYLEDVAPGQEREGRRCENLEQLTFPDNTFDLFITQDVMEHVFSPRNAFSEIM